MPTGDAATFVRTRIAQVPRRVQVEAEVAAPAASVRQRVGRWCEVEESGPSTSVVRIATESVEWAACALLGVDEAFVVRGPPELVELLARWGRRLGPSTGRQLPVPEPAT
jgi:hypothetical protein